MTLITKQYYNRDLSWLRFNHRVLQEAADVRNPLYERIKFLAIFSSNLDEFYKVRVSEIRQIKQLDKPLRKKLITKPNKLLREIKMQVDIQQKEFGRIFSTKIIPDLQKENIYLLSHKKFNAIQHEFSKDYFEGHLQKKQLLNIEKGVPFIENELLYLVGQLKDNTLIWVKINKHTPRFITIPNIDKKYCVTFVDDILKSNLKKRYKIDFYAIKISRDAELYIDNEYSGNLLDKIKKALPNRNVGQVTRALVDEMIPNKTLDEIKKILDINETDIVLGGTYHNFKDFFEFPNPTNKDFIFKKLPPIKNKDLLTYPNMFDAIDKKDRLLHFPYESFDDVIRLLEEAANDESVTTIKATLYRISKDSAIANALLKAVKNNKKVFVFIETKARFDEKNNMKWGEILKLNGAIVKFSYPGIKIHSKILYIEKKTKASVKGYAYIGTGNFNEKTAKIYTDFGLMTANKKITSEILQVFQILERELIIPKTKKLLVSPFTTRNKFTDLIETEIDNAKNGKKAYIILKLNSLQDTKMINLLYKANNAGVKIRLLIRGICCLVPDIKGQSEHIEITSIIDRFLEHERVYVFGNGGNEKLFIGSADWMTRNLDHRIEVITPILNNENYTKIRVALQIQLNDTIKARIIDSKQENKYVDPALNSNESSQHLIYRQYFNS